MENKKNAGKVVRGDGFARQMKYPTANIDLKQEDCEWGAGVYAGKARLKGVDYNAAIIIKKNPIKVEVHMFNYVGKDFYNEIVEIFDLVKVSELEKVEGKSLQEKADQDIKKIKNKLGIK